MVSIHWPWMSWTGPSSGIAASTQAGPLGDSTDGFADPAGGLPETGPSGRSPGGGQTQVHRVIEAFDQADAV
jgi:hypothetical protein